MGPGNPNVNGNNKVINNNIHHGGINFWMSAAIHIWQSGQNIVTNNLIHDMPYIGIVVTGMRPPFFINDFHHRELYGTVNRKNVAKSINEINNLELDNNGKIKDYQAMEIMDEFIYTDGNSINYNEIHHVMQVMADGNAIYFSGTGKNNKVIGNYIHDVLMYDYLGHMIRMDANQFWTDIEDNIILNSTGGISIRDGCKVINNYIINIKDLNDTANNSIYPFAIGLNDSVSKIVIKKNVVYSTKANSSIFKTKGYASYLMDSIKENAFWSVTSTDYKIELEDDKGKTFDLSSNNLILDPKFKNPVSGDFTVKNLAPMKKAGIKVIYPIESGLLTTNYKTILKK